MFSSFFTDDKQARNSQLVPASSATASIPIIQAAGVTVSSHHLEHNDLTIMIHR